MDKYELAKELGIDVAHLEKIGKEYRETLDMMNNTVLTHEQFMEWLIHQLEKLQSVRKGFMEIFTEINDLLYMSYMTDNIGVAQERMDYVDNTKDEYRSAFSAIPFSYQNKRYVVLLQYDGFAYIYDVARYGKFLGFGKEKFTNIKHYPEIKGNNYAK